MIPEVRGLGLGGGVGGGGAQGKDPNSQVSHRASKPLMQLWKLLKSSSREVKRVHFRYILGPSGPPGNGINGARGRVPQPWSELYQLS